MNVRRIRALLKSKRLTVKPGNGAKHINLGPTVIPVCPHCGKPLYDPEERNVAVRLQS